MSERYLTAPEAAALTRLSIRGLEWRRQKGIGPPVTRIGRLVRYPESKLLAWLENNTDEQSSPADAG